MSTTIITANLLMKLKAAQALTLMIGKKYLIRALPRIDLKEGKSPYSRETDPVTGGMVGVTGRNGINIVTGRREVLEMELTTLMEENYENERA